MASHADDDSGPRFSTLDVVGPIGLPEVADLYAYPDELTRCWVRANMVTSVDGGASADGKSGGLGGPGDRAVFGLLREAADVILVGAGTVRTEGYSGVRLGAAQRQSRRRRGQSEVPPIAIVTNSGDIDHDSSVFTDTEVRPLILTSRRSADDARARLGAVADVVDASGADDGAVDAAAALSALAERDLLRVLTEGGPSLLGALIQRELLDELCVTTAPMVVGGDAPRMATGPGGVQTAFRRRHLLADDDGFLYARYARSPQR